MPRHIRKGDTVIVTAGNDRRATGEVLRVLTKVDRVVVQGVNIRSKHIKPSQNSPQGGIIRREMPIHMSNVSPVVDGKPTRVRWETTEDGSKVRVAVRDNSELHTLHGPKPGRAASATTKPTRRKMSKKRTKKTAK